jgi:hypothetical protein
VGHRGCCACRCCRLWHWRHSGLFPLQVIGLHLAAALLKIILSVDTVIYKAGNKTIVITKNSIYLVATLLFFSVLVDKTFLAVILQFQVPTVK